MHLRLNGACNRARRARGCSQRGRLRACLAPPAAQPLGRHQPCRRATAGHQRVILPQPYPYPTRCCRVSETSWATAVRWEAIEAFPEEAGSKARKCQAHQAGGSHALSLACTCSRATAELIPELANPNITPAYTLPRKHELAARG